MIVAGGHSRFRLRQWPPRLDDLESPNMPWDGTELWEGERYFVSQIFGIAIADPIEPVEIENFSAPLAYRFDR